MNRIIIVLLLSVAGCASTGTQPAKSEADRRTGFGQCRGEVANLPPSSKADSELECDIRGEDRARSKDETRKPQ